MQGRERFFLLQKAAQQGLLREVMSAAEVEQVLVGLTVPGCLARAVWHTMIVGLEQERNGGVVVEEVITETIGPRIKAAAKALVQEAVDYGFLTQPFASWSSGWCYASLGLADMTRFRACQRATVMVPPRPTDVAEKHSIPLALVSRIQESAQAMLAREIRQPGRRPYNPEWVKAMAKEVIRAGDEPIPYRRVAGPMGTSETIPPDAGDRQRAYWVLEKAGFQSGPHPWRDDPYVRKKLGLG